MKSLIEHIHQAARSARCVFLTGLVVCLLANPLTALCQANSQSRYYYAIENLDSASVVRRGLTTSAGLPSNELILAPNTNYREWLFRADNGLIGFADFRTPPSGSRFTIPPITLRLPLTPDSDGDGLSDDAEFVLGTNPTNPDTDGDGINDGTAIQLGLDPGAAARTGIVGSVDTPGTAVDACAFNDIVVVADSDRGISVFNVFNRMAPLIIAQVPTPGTATAVACSGNLIAVADGPAGLTVVDIADPPKARIVQQVNLGAPAQAVTVAGGIAYVGLTSGQIMAVDMASGAIVDQGNIGSAVHDLGIEGDHLFALSYGELRSYDLTGRLQTNLGATSVSGDPPEGITAKKRLFVGGGVAYVTAYRGYETFSVTNAGAMTRIGAIQDVGFNSFKQVVANGSGLALVVVGVNPRDDGTHDLSLYGADDPAQTINFITTFPTPGLARAVALFNGLAYVADGEAGLQVINYLGFDTSNRPPTITLEANFPILSPTNGIAEGGQLVRVTANVTDDVQVRNVEFYVNGTKVATDGNFPFEYRFVAPVRTANRTSFRLSARASDTGGNFTFTPEMTVEVLPDIRPPQITRFSPRDGSAVGNVNSITVFFTEPVDTNTLSGAVTVTDAGLDGMYGTADDRLMTNYAIVFREDVLGLFINFSTNLTFGSYHVSLSTSVTDLNSNRLATATDWQFRVVPCLEEIPGLVAWWTADGDARDIVQGNDGTLLNGATIANGFNGAAFSFDGNNYVEVPDSPDLRFAGTSPMTVELWAHPTASPGVMHYLGKRVGCGSGSWQFQLAHDGRGLHFSSTEPVAGSGRFLPINEWHHLAATFDGTAVEIYIDGGSVLRANHMLGPENSSPFLIGGSGTCQAGFVGLMDEIAIYNRALTSNEIADIYSVGTVGKCKDIAPRATRFSPADGTVTESNRVVGVYFSKSMDPSTLNTNSIVLTEAGSDRTFGTVDDQPIQASSVNYSNALRAAFLQFTNDLPLGLYRVTATTETADLGGKALYARKDGTFWILPGGADGDQDNDGLTNGEEVQHGTNPLLADTDGDGWTDEVELADGKDPLNPNSRPQITIVAGPPVEIVFPGPDESGTPGAGTTVAQPPIEVIFPGADETGIIGSGTTVANPPVDIIFPGVDETGSSGAGTTLAQPPIIIQYQP